MCFQLECIQTYAMFVFSLSLSLFHLLHPMKLFYWKIESFPLFFTPVFSFRWIIFFGIQFFLSLGTTSIVFVWNAFCTLLLTVSTSSCLPFGTHIEVCMCLWVRKREKREREREFSRNVLVSFGFFFFLENKSKHKKCANRKETAKKKARKKHWIGSRTYPRFCPGAGERKLKNKASNFRATRILLKRRRRKKQK